MLENENELLRERIEMLTDTIMKRVRVPIEWELTRQEERILGMILDRELATRDAILTHLYGMNAPGDLPDIKIIDVFVHKLRRKLQKYLPYFTIETKWGTGYYASRESKAMMTRLLQQRSESEITVE